MGVSHPPRQQESQFKAISIEESKKILHKRTIYQDSNYPVVQYILLLFSYLATIIDKATTLEDCEQRPLSST
jgi:hypothetical protein